MLTASLFILSIYRLFLSKKTAPGLFSFYELVLGREAGETEAGGAELTHGRAITGKGCSSGKGCRAGQHSGVVI